jgi:hypothetical protein
MKFLALLHMNKHILIRHLLQYLLGTSMEHSRVLLRNSIQALLFHIQLQFELALHLHCIPIQYLHLQDVQRGRNIRHHQHMRIQMALLIQRVHIQQVIFRRFLLGRHLCSSIWS